MSIHTSGCLCARLLTAACCCACSLPATFLQVRQLLDLWVKQGRVSADTAKPVHQQMSVFERQAAAVSQLSSLGIPPGLPVQRVILTAHEQPLNLEELMDRMLLERDVSPGADPAAAAGKDGGGAVGAKAGAAAAQAPDSPSEEGLLAALVADADLEEGEVVQPPSPDIQQQQEQQQPQPEPEQQLLPTGPLHFKNLFGPATVSGYVLKQYNTVDHFCQLPLVSAIEQHLGKQAAASAAAASAKKQGSGTRASGLLAVLQQRGLELRWSPEVLSARNEDWLLEDHEQVCGWGPQHRLLATCLFCCNLLWGRGWMGRRVNTLELGGPGMRIGCLRTMNRCVELVAGLGFSRGSPGCLRSLRGEPAMAASWLYVMVGLWVVLVGLEYCCWRSLHCVHYTHAADSVKAGQTRTSAGARDVIQRR